MKKYNLTLEIEFEAETGEQALAKMKAIMDRIIYAKESEEVSFDHYDIQYSGSGSVS